MRKLSAGTPNSARSTVSPASSVALKNDTPNGETRTPSTSFHAVRACSSRLDRLKLCSAPGWSARWVIGRSRSPEMPSSTSPVARPDSNVVSSATRAITTPTSTNRPRATRRSLHARNIRLLRDTSSTSCRRTVAKIATRCRQHNPTLCPASGVGDRPVRSAGRRGTQRRRATGAGATGTARHDGTLRRVVQDPEDRQARSARRSARSTPHGTRRCRHRCPPALAWSAVIRATG